VALREALGRRVGLDVARTWVANGSNEVLLQLMLAYGGAGRRVLLTRPGYSMYPELARTTATATTLVDLDDAFVLDAERAREAVAASDPDLIVVASPNNPVGTLVSRETVRALHDASRALVVVDEAYIEFAPPGSSVVDLVGELDRLVVSRTFSKAFRLAGLRLGYLHGPAWVVDDLQKVRLPYHLDAITQVAGLVAIEHEDSFLAHRAGTVLERERIAAALARRGDVEVMPSSANFLLLRTDLDDLFDRLLAAGVLVRDVSRGAGLARCVRVTVGTPDENDRFLAAVEAALDAARR
jgi:histidinol-phosphate aminotransferase